MRAFDGKPPDGRRRAGVRAARGHYETISAVTPSTSESPFIRACRRQPVPRTPVWFMRQAGRALPEYRATRAGTAMLEACATPDLITEITLQPLRRYGVDAAIFYSDIVVPLAAAGIDLDIVSGVGPVIAEPVRTRADVERIRPLEPADVPDIADAVRALVAELGPTPLIWPRLASSRGRLAAIAANVLLWATV